MAAKSGDKKQRFFSLQGDGNPKKKNSKYCALCEKHSGAKMTHNTEDCRNYKKDATFKKGFRKPKDKDDKKSNGQSFEAVRKILRT